MSPSHAKRRVIKVGSSLLVDAVGNIRQAWLATLVADIAAERAADTQIIIVSSGAVALGARRLGLEKGGRASLEDAQAAAATGQIALAGCWAALLAEQDIKAAQMLVTNEDFEDRRRYLNITATLERLMSLGVVPIINENDTVATDEIRVGDNDRLAERVAQAARAHDIILLSDVDGLYTADPTSDPKAQRVPEVTRVDARIMAMAGQGSSSGIGSGGIITKLDAARAANRAGIDLVLVSGQHGHPLTRLANEDVGTRFIAQPAASARKAWLAGRLAVRGVIVIDDGAARALSRGGVSLLAAGARRVSGAFQRGDVVDIADATGHVIARGLSEYDAGDTARICGKRTPDLADILGYAPRAALVHCDHMVLL
ncbi:MAG: glutamate 5-kinase [Alphaproteobacteria bacterium]|nr:glutamate 5-kinase [Alphaproteobacteria bacterium]MDE2041579.1 glutamate 5-kinase [Alphaproteobacteria bacterium]MDE2341122.1 glutamate 5-kinase [Alphaproteobacteria bacterium]